MAIDIHCYIFFERLVYLKDGPFDNVYKMLDLDEKIVNYVEHVRKFDLIAFNINNPEVINSYYTQISEGKSGMSVSEAIIKHFKW